MENVETDSKPGQSQKEGSSSMLDFFGFSRSPFGSTPPLYPDVPENLEDELEAVVNKCWYTSDLVLVSHELVVDDNPVSQMFLENLGEDFESAVVVVSLMLTGDELLQLIADAFSIQIDIDGYEHEENVEFICRFFETAQLKNREFLLIIQNVHEIGTEALDVLMQLISQGLRLPYLHFVLWGRKLGMTLPDIQAGSNMPEISIFTLPDLSFEEVEGYLADCLEAAGYKGEPLFTRAIIEKIQREALGDQHLINSLAMSELERQFLEAQRLMSPSAGEETQALNDEPQDRPEVEEEIDRSGMLLPYRHLVMVVILIVILGGLFWGFGGEEERVDSDMAVSSPQEDAPGESGLLLRESAADQGQDIDVSETVDNYESEQLLTINNEIEDEVEDVVQMSLPEDQSLSSDIQIIDEAGEGLQQQLAESVSSEVENGAVQTPLLPVDIVEDVEQELQPQSRLEVNEQRLLTISDDRYFLQLFGAYDEGAAIEFIEEYEDLELWYYQDQYQGRDWYVVVMGDYASAQAAIQARQGLPDVILRGGPFSKSMVAIRQAILAE